MDTPATQKNIAIIGTAPHFNQAPFADPDWSIWVASYYLFPILPRWDAWFEIHHIDRVRAEGHLDATLEGLLKTDHGKPVWMTDHYPDFPNSLPVPREALEQEFGQYFFTSTFAWMFAMAIMLKPAKIGLWGVDCAAAGEYASQRPGAQFFMEMARQRGIEVVLPPASMLTVRAPHYGIENFGRAETLMVERLATLRKRKDELLESHRNVVRDINVVDGAVAVIEDMLTGHLGHWTAPTGQASSVYKEKK